MKRALTLFLVSVWTFVMAHLVVSLVYRCDAPGSVPCIAGAPAQEPEPERKAVFRPETHAAIADLRARLEAADAEARCKSNRERLESGDCDPPSKR